MNRFAVSHYACPPDMTAEAFFELAAGVGAGAVGLTVRAVDELDVSGLRSRLADHGLAVSSLNSAGYLTLPEGDAWEAQQDLNRRLIDCAAELNAAVLCVITGGLEAAGFDLKAARGRIEDRFAALADAAAGKGVRLGIEPIHPAEMANKGCVNSISAGRALATAANTALVVDHFHSWWDPELPELFGTAIEEVALVQFCNVTPPDNAGGFRRAGLSQTGIRGMDTVRHAEHCGYRGWYEFELFADDLRGRHLHDILRAAAREMVEAGLTQGGQG